MTIDAVLKQMTKDFGESRVSDGNTVVESGCVPTGIFALDLMLGGGIPKGRITEIFGVSSACKSNVCNKIVATAQRLEPKKKVVWVAVEPFDPVWAARFGVVTKDLILLKPEYSQQAIDMIEAVVSEPEVSLVVLDSFAAMSTQNELEKSAEAHDPGGIGKMGKLLFNKIMTRQRELEESGQLSPTFVFTNQMRHKVGVMFGSPESSPGGFAKEHACALRLRLYAKEVVDPKVSKTIAARKEVKCTVKKHKVPIVARECEFEMAMIPQHGLKPGQVANWRTLVDYLQKHELLVKDGKNYTMNGETYTTLVSIKEKVEADQELYDVLSRAIIVSEVDAIYNGLNTASSDAK